MSKLEELIKEYCPGGVEYKSLGEFATVSRGGNFQKKDFLDSGFPCIHYGQIYTRYGLFADSTFTFISEDRAAKQKKASKNDIIMAVTSENIEDVCKCLAWLGEDEVAVSGHTAIIKHNQNPKYLVYYFHTEMFFAQKKKLAHGTKVIEVTPDKLLSIKIPLPPLPVQREIVRILDNFTDLTAELTAELAARKKQYEYYRDRILAFEANGASGKYGGMGCLDKMIKELCPDGVEYSAVGMFAKAEKGKNKDRHCDKAYSITKNGLVPTEEYFKGAKVTSDDTSGYRLVKRNWFVYSPSRIDVGSVNYLRDEEEVIVSPLNVVFSIDSQKISPKYLLYYLQSREGTWQIITSREGIEGTGRKLLPFDKFAKIQVPLPPLEIQQKIVSVLDRFDTLCNDLTSGLPAEIEARQKQYEYYRDKLLSFEIKN